MNQTLQISELFGPTIQGEGVDIGRPCLFVRLHNCPVRCPGCDTHYTWDGSERGTTLPLTAEAASPQDKPNPVGSLAQWLQEKLTAYPHCGIVLTGGEPLLHYANKGLILVLAQCMQEGWDTTVAGTNYRWISLETSGFVGKVPIAARGQLHTSQLATFLGVFSTVHLSPKVTPCLHGVGWPDQDLLNNVKLFMKTLNHKPDRLVFKLVARDEADVEVVARLNEQMGWMHAGHRVYLMAYGNERDELLQTCERLVPLAAKYGFIISPRLHALMWGKERLR